MLQSKRFYVARDTKNIQGDTNTHTHTSLWTSAGSCLQQSNMSCTCRFWGTSASRLLTAERLDTRGLLLTTVKLHGVSEFEVDKKLAEALHS